MPSVLVAMSGGVDSSVAACLLHEQGYEVLGSHLSLVHLEGVEHGCCGPSARRDAAETARIAGFPFEICDLSDEFERTVIADFVGELASGRTPNPCARCNSEIKFGAFLRPAMPAASCGAAPARWYGKAARSLTRTDACSPSTTGPSPSRSGSDVGSGWRPVPRCTSPTSTRSRTASW